MTSVGLDGMLPLLILEHDLEVVIAASGRVLGVGVEERDLESAEVLFDERRRVQGRVIGSGFRQLVQLDPARAVGVRLLGTLSSGGKEEGGAAPSSPVPQ